MVLLSKKKIDSLTPSDLDIQTRKIRFFEQIGKESQHCVLHMLEQVASLTAEKEIVGVASAKFEKFLQWKQARREFIRPNGTVQKLIGTPLSNNLPPV